MGSSGAGLWELPASDKMRSLLKDEDFYPTRMGVVKRHSCVFRPTGRAESAINPTFGAEQLLHTVLQVGKTNRLVKIGRRPCIQNPRF